MGTILDNKRDELDALIALMQEDIEAMQAAVQKRETDLRRLQDQRRELADYEPAVDPHGAEE